MNRSGYGACDEDEADEWFRDVAKAIASPEGQAFLRELAAAMDAMTEKVLIANELVNDDGDCCTIGVVCKARGIDATHMDSAAVAEWLGAPLLLVAEIIDNNDDNHNDTPETRWQRVRRWVDKRIRKDGGT